MCCANCFNDNWISGFIDTRIDVVAIDECIYCGSRNVKSINPVALKPYFDTLIEEYVLDDKGVDPILMLNQDWNLFKVSGVNAQKLLSDILQGTLISNFVPKSDSMKIQWNGLKNELKHSNRFFPKNSPDLDSFRKLIENLLVSDVPIKLYRSRIIKNVDKAYNSIDMLAPPPELASDGRANPVGIPYLYLASDTLTAVSEVRPSKISQVAVAEFNLVFKDLKIIDLSNPKDKVSPFVLLDQSKDDIRNIMTTLCVLGDELSAPILQHRANIDYLASQYLCELIKNVGFDGVMYSSSQTTGFNYAFFNVESYVPSEDIKRYLVTSTHIEIQEQF